MAGSGALALGYSGVTFFFLLSGFILAYTYRDVDFRDSRPGGPSSGCVCADLPGLPRRARGPRAVVPQPRRDPAEAVAGADAVGRRPGTARPSRLDPRGGLLLDCPSWSISVELFFYALFPVLLPLVLRDPGRIAVATLALWVATVALATLVWGAYGGGASLLGPEPGGVGPVLLAEFIKYFPPMHLPVFIAGLLLFAMWQNQRPPAAGLLALSGAFAVLIVAAAGVVPDTVLHNGLTVLVWAPLILACATMRRGPLCSRPLVFLAGSPTPSTSCISPSWRCWTVSTGRC